EVGKRLAREAGADLAGVAQRTVLQGADENRAEVGARALGRGVAADDEFLLGANLHLAPSRRALARLVDRRRVLGHYALETALAGGLERLETVAGQTSRQAQRAGEADFLVERGASLREGQRHEIAAPGEQAVEDDVDGPAAGVGAEELEAR